jgi:hypothetical protein
MNKFLAWYNRNYQAITWFLTGWMSFALLVDFSHGDWAGCAFDILIIFINVLVARK